MRFVSRHCFAVATAEALFINGLLFAQEPPQAPSQAGVQTVQPSAVPTASKKILPEGTPVRMRISRTVTSAEAQVGENVDFETLDDVRAGDVVVIPAGSTAIATVTEAHPKRRMGRGGKLSMNIDYVRLPSGYKLPLRGVQNIKGGGHTGAMTGAMVATGIVFFPAAPLFLFMHGKDITIPKGHEVTVYTNTDYEIPNAQASAPVPAAAAPAKVISGTPLTNDDIVKLKEAGLTEELIIEKISSSPANYRLETDNIIALKKAGVSDAVITAMIRAGQR